MKTIGLCSLLLSLYFIQIASADDTIIPDGGRYERFANTLTLSWEEIDYISAIFIAVVREEEGIALDKRAVTICFREFVWKGERFVLQNGSFPFHLAIKIFDTQLFVGSESDGVMPTPFSTSNLAIKLLKLGWQDALKESMALLMRQSLFHRREDGFNTIAAYAEQVHLISAVLSALVDGPSDTLFDMGIENYLLGRGVTKKVKKEEVRIESKKGDVFGMLLIFFPILFFVNVVGILFTVIGVFLRRKR